MSSSRKYLLLSRLFRGLGAQTYVRIVQIIIRLAEVPLLMAYWGPQLYGEWLMLSAIPSYLSIGDGGFSTAACREMTMRSGAGDQNGVRSVFQSTWILLLIVSVVVALAAILFVQTVPLARWLGFEQISQGQSKVVLLLLVSYVLIGFQGGLLNGGFWVSGRYPIGMTLSATSTIFEFAGLAIAVLLGGGPIYAAIGYLGGRLLGVLMLWMGQRRVTPWLRYGFHHVSMKEIHSLTRPAFASLAFPLGNAFNIEGMRLVVGLVLSPAAVAVFVPIRTLSRLATQPRAVVNQLIQPEMALAYGSHNDGLFRKIFLQSCQLSFWASIAVCLLLVATGNFILPHWTAGRIAMHWPLFLTLLSAVMVNGLWHTALMVPYATNRHGRIAVIYTLIYGLFAVLFGFIGSQSFGLVGAGLALIAAELIMAIYTIREALRLSDVRLKLWVQSVMWPPLHLVRHGIIAFYNFMVIKKNDF